MVLLAQTVTGSQTLAEALEMEGSARGYISSIEQTPDLVFIVSWEAID